MRSALQLPAQRISQSVITIQSNMSQAISRCAPYASRPLSAAQAGQLREPQHQHWPACVHHPRQPRRPVRDRCAVSCGRAVQLRPGQLLWTPRKLSHADMLLTYDC